MLHYGKCWIQLFSTKRQQVEVRVSPLLQNKMITVVFYHILQAPQHYGSEILHCRSKTKSSVCYILKLSDTFRHINNVFASQLHHRTPGRNASFDVCSHSCYTNWWCPMCNPEPCLNNTPVDSTHKQTSSQRELCEHSRCCLGWHNNLQTLTGTDV